MHDPPDAGAPYDKSVTGTVVSRSVSGITLAMVALRFCTFCGRRTVTRRRSWLAPRRLDPRRKCVLAALEILEDIGRDWRSAGEDEQLNACRGSARRAPSSTPTHGPAGQAHDVAAGPAGGTRADRASEPAVGGLLPRVVCRCCPDCGLAPRWTPMVQPYASATPDLSAWPDRGVQPPGWWSPACPG